MFFLLLLFTIPNIICDQNHQRIPLRYEVAIDFLKQIQHSNFAALLNNVSKYTITPEKISSYISLAATNEATQCERDFDIMVQGILNRDMWALKVIDAWGKPAPSSILKGNVYWVGDYDECLQRIYLPNNKTFVSQPFDTQHCTLYTDIFVPQLQMGRIDLVLGLCVPSSCDRQGLNLLINTLFNQSNNTEADLVCSNDPRNGQRGLTHGAIGTIVILSILGFLVFVGSIIDLVLMLRCDAVRSEISDIVTNDNVAYDVMTDRASPNLPRYSVQALIDTIPGTGFLVEFSALKTLRRIFTTKQKNNNETYPFIHGIRVLSLFWVIIGHSFIFGTSFSINPLEVVVWSRSVIIQLISGAWFSVDTFFVLSGFLTTIIFIREVEKEQKMSLRLMSLYYIHRYIRLTPTFLIVIAISINLTAYFGSGPVYATHAGFEVPLCRSQYWWTSILYVGNIVKSESACLPVSWYLYNDMQFHWVAPLALIPFVMKQKRIGFIVTILFILAGIASIAGLLITNPNLHSPGNLVGSPPPGHRSFTNTIYITPWCRMSAYFVGVFTGFFVVNVGRSYRMNKCTVIICSILAILFALICILGLYPDYILESGMSRTPFILYESFCRTLWSLTIGWILLLCMINQGGIINNILSWSIWAPLARLNYSCYLTHASVITIMNYNQRLPFYYQPHLVINNFVSHIFFSYLIALVVVIFIETPFFIIEKKIFKR